MPDGRIAQHGPGHSGRFGGSFVFLAGLAERDPSVGQEGGDGEGERRSGAGRVEFDVWTLVSHWRRVAFSRPEG